MIAILLGLLTILIQGLGLIPIPNITGILDLLVNSFDTVSQLVSSMLTRIREYLMGIPAAAGGVAGALGGVGALIVTVIDGIVQSGFSILNTIRSYILEIPEVGLSIGFIGQLVYELVLNVVNGLANVINATNQLTTL